MTDKDPRDLLEFPCDYQFKAIGAAGERFRRDVCTVVSRHADAANEAVNWQESRHGNYQSVSLRVTLQSYEQMTLIYAELKTLDGLKMLL